MAGYEKPIKLPLVGNVSPKGMMIGAGILALVLVAPIAVNPVVDFLTGIRDKIAGMMKGGE